MITRIRGPRGGTVPDGSRSARALFDADSQHRVGAAGDLPLVAVPAQDSMCARVVAGGTRITTADATVEPRFDGNPFTSGPDAVRFYSSTPVRDDDGEVLVTLCVFDPDRIELDGARLALLETSPSLAYTLLGRADQAMYADKAARRATRSQTPS